MSFQSIYDIAEICAQQGVNRAVICPGSRCAPLTLAFTRHDGIGVKTFSDERSAGFVALGMAQQTKSPVILLCTSGSAAYNFAPAVAEAFFQRTPLIVFSADRPPEWIDQWDGQTIRQQSLYGNHVKRSFQLPEDYTHRDAQWMINRTINEAIQIATAFPQGPVHINAPFREPLYPSVDEKIQFTKAARVIRTSEGEPLLGDQDKKIIRESLQAFDRILVVAGQHEVDETLIKRVDKFSKQHQTVVAGDVISNFHKLPGTIRHADAFLGQGGDGLKKSLRPELLITFGQSVISKNLKLFLRNHPPTEHWHIQESGTTADTFQALTRVIHTTPASFFLEFIDTPGKDTPFEIQKRENYGRLWEAEEHRTQRSLKSWFVEPQLTELHLIHEFMHRLPSRCNLHLANSMSVRYANLIGIEASKKGVHVFANRGTSGIDGCTSTAVGHALCGDVPNFLITGDMAFFYDRNAFWHNYPIANLHILVLNNHGGTIFNLIDGPSQLPEKDEFFITEQKLSARHLAAEYKFEYLKLDQLRKWKNLLDQFMDFDGHTKILEMESDAASNLTSFEQFKQHIKKGYERH